MKNLLLLIILHPYFLFSQEIKKDTIEININDIKIIKDAVQSNPRLSPSIPETRIDTLTEKPLNGLYKIKVSSTEYSLINYKNGAEDNIGLSFVKHYKNDKLTSIEVKGVTIIGSSYISIPNYNFISGYLNGYTKDYSSNQVLDKIKIYQKIKKKRIDWKMYYPNKIVRKLKLDKNLLYSQKNRNINKASKSDRIDVGTYINKINSQNLSKSDTILNKGIKLDNKAVKFLKLNNIDKTSKNFYFCRKIDVSKNFLSIIISSENKDQTDWYLINYDQHFEILDSLLIFKNVHNVNHISSKISNNKVSTTEEFIDQGQAIVQSWETKINDDGKFEK